GDNGHTVFIIAICRKYRGIYRNNNSWGNIAFRKGMFAFCYASCYLYIYNRILYGVFIQYFPHYCFQAVIMHGKRNAQFRQRTAQAGAMLLPVQQYAAPGKHHLVHAICKLAPSVINMDKGIFMRDKFVIYV